MTNRRLLKGFINFAVVTVLISFCTIAFTQDSLHVDEVEVIKAFDIRLSETKKIQWSPSSYVIPVTPKSFEYNLKLTSLDLDYPAPYIRPIAMNADEKLKISTGFVKAGYGNLENPIGIVRINKSVENYYNLGLQFNYESIKEKNITNKENLDIQGKINLDYFLTESMKAYFKGGGGIQNVHFYGFNEGILLGDVSENVRKFTRINLEGGIESLDHDSEEAIAYNAGISYQYIKSDDINRAENQLDLYVEARKYIGDSGAFTLRGGGDLSFLKDTISQSFHHYYIQPILDFNFESLHVQLGGTAKSDGKQFHVFPNAELSLSAFGAKTKFFLGAEGDLWKNDMLNTVEYNPYINLNFDTLVNTKYYRLYLGANGNIGNKISFYLESGYKITKDHFLFLNDFDKEIRQFQILYDDINVIYGILNVRYNATENIGVSINVKQNWYDLELGNEAWHLPSSEWSAALELYFFDHKLLVKPETRMSGKIDQRDLSRNAIQSEFIINNRLELSYQFAKSISVFALGTNLTANKNERWYGYPGYDRRFQGGISIVF